ncbi:hydrogenase maturation protease [Heliophilum fasciatum]|uniref:Hydrogenase maturation protease n=1 Tax=Heliophilum fasciatum TaxID=35700 RepID=A0A4R2RYT4_9FIRM|nr:hydrogenase maturation protease [Heliophilum fasciatum]MCW2276845.1 hydrogenase maturation protease [Heliophilum fasciatum]TCP68694.1 hydrogenase maturation protease [Heliophilum fasciatum]
MSSLHPMGHLYPTNPKSPTSPPANALILGIGNRLMSDDGIGVALVEAWQKEQEAGCPTSGPRTYCLGESDVDYCINQIACLSPGDALIIIDAAYLGQQSGQITVLPWKQVFAELPCRLDAHSYHLFHALALLRPQSLGCLIAIEPFSLDWGDQLSPAMAQRFPFLLLEVHRIIDRHLQGRSSYV